MSLKCWAQEEQAYHIKEDMADAAVEELICYKPPQLYNHHERDRPNRTNSCQEGIAADYLEKVYHYVYY